MSLLTSLISYWKLDEASGSRADAHGSNTLTDNNTVGSATGKIGDAADFELSNSEYLSHASNSDLETGDIDWTFAAWVNADSLSAGFQTILSKDATAAREYLIYYEDGSTNRFSVAVFVGVSTVVLRADTLGAASTGTWYYVVIWHDSTADTINIQVNNGAVDSSATGGSLNAATAAEFRVGGRATIASLIPWDGLIDEVGFWKRTLTTQERTDLYNAGVGFTYPFSSGTTVTPGTAGLVITPFAPIVSAPSTMMPGKLSLVLTPFPPSVEGGTVIPGGGGGLRRHGDLWRRTRR